MNYSDGITICWCECRSIQYCVGERKILLWQRYVKRRHGSRRADGYRAAKASCGVRALYSYI